MKLLPEITPRIIDLLSFTPLQYMLHAVESSPEISMVYADDEITPSSCVVRIGSLLFFGGEITSGCLAYLKTKILTFEIYEKYGVFYFFYPDELWCNALITQFPDRSKIYERTLYSNNSIKASQARRLTAIVPITENLMGSNVKNREIIMQEVTTYKTFDHFLKNGIGYTVLIDEEIHGFCTSEYQSGTELAIGIEVTKSDQKEGYAKAMTFAFLENAIQKGFKVYWESWANNTASINTALSCGFQHEADYPVIYLDLLDLNRNGRAPEECVVQNIVQKYLEDTETVERVLKGASTYVYQVKTSSETYYARFLPEDCSFAPEVLAHQRMTAIGVNVPQIVAFEHKEQRSELSMMLVKEIPGASMEDVWPDDGVSDILREAGRQLALIHTISVDGFGWMDRNCYDTLKGEKDTFSEYFNDYLDDDLNTLHYYDFSTEEKRKICNYMEQARLILDIDTAVLVHGDFDISHIFHSAGKFSGFIDFGEIRGNHRFFDLAVFTLNDSSLNRMAYSYLVDGYCEITHISDDDLYAIELLALFIALRFAGKKVETKSREYWYWLIKKQLERISQSSRGLEDRMTKTGENASVM